MGFLSGWGHKHIFFADNNHLHHTQDKKMMRCRSLCQQTQAQKKSSLEMRPHNLKDLSRTTVSIRGCAAKNVQSQFIFQEVLTILRFTDYHLLHCGKIQYSNNTYSCIYNKRINFTDTLTFLFTQINTTIHYQQHHIKVPRCFPILTSSLQNVYIMYIFSSELLCDLSWA